VYGAGIKLLFTCNELVTNKELITCRPFAVKTVGVTPPDITYAADPTVLLEYPVATASTLIVSEALTVIAPVYRVEPVVGEVPLVV
jgi:hypothetical protein